VLNNSADYAYSMAQSRSGAKFAEVSKMLGNELRMLGRGVNGIAFECENQALKVYKKGDIGYTNFVRLIQSINAQEQWTNYLPKILLFEEFEQFNIVVLERLETSETIDKKYKPHIEAVVKTLTPVGYRSVTGALHTVYGRFLYKGLMHRQHEIGARMYNHHVVSVPLEAAMTNIIELAYKEGTACDLRPENVMFRNVNDNFQPVIIDPFCLERRNGE
jgi:hypothetical protein